jgi:hypothetical protein
LKRNLPDRGVDGLARSMNCRSEFAIACAADIVVLLAALAKFDYIRRMTVTT